MEEACGAGKEFVVILKHGTMNEAIERILRKVSVEKTIASMLIKGKFKDKQVNIFKTGKLVISKFHGKEEAENFLEELLK